MINNSLQAYYVLKSIGKDLEIGKMENLVPQYLRSGIEIFSHQIYASMLALSNPFVKGFILADEAGLGKTMEALLILSQYQNSKSKCLVVVPSPTINTWLHNIIRIFNYRCYLLDNKEMQATENIKTSLKDYNSGIVLTSYDYINSNEGVFKEHDWDLCILDEAHRFRTYKIKENKTAETILSITRNAKKILLTATPIQKNEDDIYGLISFIDDEIFNDYEEFHKRYFRKPENYPELRDIISPYIFRTLRNQVDIETKLPSRQILTQIYEMTDQENRLYKLLESYISKPVKFAFPDMDPYELSLMLYGTLSSSAYALSKTLSGIYTRLVKNATEENLKEASEIRDMLDLATSITKNNKDELILKALEKTFTIFHKKGISKKCIIFAGNTQSQEHIQKYLKLYTDYSIFVFNGTTDDDPIKRFFSSENPSVLISTDKGNESLNWQEAAFVINYDYPQILMEMEQRISRCHRIGQKNDVFVLNFICPDNFSDVRTYELFYKRMNTSEKVIGASDNIISGALKGSIEENITNTLNNVRKAKVVQIDFSELGEKFKEELDSVKAQSNDILFNSFDKAIVERTKNMAEIIKRKIKELECTIHDLARFYYKNNFISENILEVKTKWHEKNPFARPSKYSLSRADEDCSYFSFSSEPCQDMILNLLSFPDLKPKKLILKSHNLKIKSGYIFCFDLKLNMGYHSFSKTVCLGLDDNGNFISDEDCDKILKTECLETEDISISQDIITNIENHFEKLIPDIIKPLKAELDKNMNLPISHIKNKGGEQKLHIDKQIQDLKKQIDFLKGTSANDNYFEGLVKNQKINELSEEYFQLKDDEYDNKSKINRETNKEIEEFYKNNALNYNKKTNFMLYFEER